MVKKPMLGCSFRNRVKSQILAALNQFDVLEFMVDHYLVSGVQNKNVYQEISEKIPTVLHSVGLSIGSCQHPSPEYLKGINMTLADLRSEIYSEHISFSRANGIDTSLLIPMPFTDEAAERLIKNIIVVKNSLPVALCLENISYYYTYPQSKYSEIDFYKLLLQETGAYMLLDLENLRINSMNHHYDPFEYIKNLPYGIVKYIHLAGGVTLEKLEIDTHDQLLSKEVFHLLEYTLSLQNPDYIILERDNRLESFNEVLLDCQTVRKIINKVYHEKFT